MNETIIRHLDFGVGAMIVGIGAVLWSFPDGSLLHDFGFLLPLFMAYAWSLAIVHVGD